MKNPYKQSVKIEGSAEISWHYPDIYSEDPDILELELLHTRAADSIRIYYSSMRDGWVIMQASTFTWSGDDPICDQDWQEVAFVEAWAREKKEGIEEEEFEK